ncbi:MAG: addiction module protein [Propionibacteriaceae bacterium]|jgi:hypothetical protein|nr:addiction module protein [Propionibacteriaceae bacterium]
MTLADLLPLARSLDSADRRVLAEELWLSLDDEPVDPEVLRLIEERVSHIHAHPEKCVEWAEFEKQMDEKLGPVPA